MKFYIETFGCKVNLYESNYISEKLIEYGFDKTSDFKVADIVIINTCSVTHNADNKSAKFYRRVKRDNPSSFLVVCGCSSQYDYNKYEGANLILGNSNKNSLPDLIINNLEKKELIEINMPSCFSYDKMNIKSFFYTRAFVKIQDGCHNFCSYCIIPYLRGPLRFKEYNAILKEVNDLVNNGYKEIVLTGINTGTYKSNNKNLVDLINDLSKIEKLYRIRLSSIEITELKEDFMEMLKHNKKFSNHLHVPLQAGSNKVLKLMNRKYDLKYYISKINEIRNIRSDISISTDIIVGHPGESEEDFLETIKTSKEVKFSKIHVFPYSNRIGTRASKMDNQIDREIIKNRSRELITVGKKMEQEYNSRFLNQELEILIEENKNGFSYGHTDNYIRLKIKDNLDVNTLHKLIVKNDNLC